MPKITVFPVKMCPPLIPIGEGITMPINADASASIIPQMGLCADIPDEGQCYQALLSNDECSMPITLLASTIKGNLLVANPLSVEHTALFVDWMDHTQSAFGFADKDLEGLVEDLRRVIA